MLKLSVLGQIFNLVPLVVDLPEAV